MSKNLRAALMGFLLTAATLSVPAYAYNVQPFVADTDTDAGIGPEVTASFLTTNGLPLQLQLFNADSPDSSNNLMAGGIFGGVTNVNLTHLFFDVSGPENSVNGPFLYITGVTEHQIPVVEKIAFSSLRGRPSRTTGYTTYQITPATLRVLHLHIRSIAVYIDSLGENTNFGPVLINNIGLNGFSPVKTMTTEDLSPTLPFPL
jgi:hypothetical protein